MAFLVRKIYLRSYNLMKRSETVYDNIKELYNNPRSKRRNCWNIKMATKRTMLLLRCYDDDLGKRLW